MSGNDLNEGVLSILVRDRLKYESGGHAAGRDHKLFGLAILTGGLVVVALHRCGEQFYDVVHQHQGTHAVNGRTAQHREQGQFPHTLTQALNHFGVGKVLTVEEFIHKLLAGLGHRLFQCLIELVNHTGLVLGQLNFHPLELLHLIGPLVQHVNDTGNLFVVVPNGHHHRGDFVAILLPQGFKGGIIVRVVFVCFRDIDKAGHIPLFTVFPCLLQTHRDAVFGGADNNRRIGGPESFHHFAREVEAARSIQNIDFTALELHRGHGQGDGNLAFDLFGVIVAYGVAVGGSAHAVDSLGHVQQALRQGGFTTAAVSNEGHIANILYRIAHNWFHSFSFGYRPGQKLQNGRYTLLVIIHERSDSDNSFFEGF